MLDRRQPKSLPDEEKWPEKLERRKKPRRRELAPILGETIVKYEQELQEKQRRFEEELRQRELEIDKLRIEVNEKAYIDEMTGLASRRAFDEKFPELVDIAKANNEPLALLFFDADELHELNKEFQHAAGDELLKAIANALKGNSRPTDLVARLGGDEFGVVLTGFRPVDGVSTSGLITDTIQRFRDSINKEIKDRGLVKGGATFSIAILGSDETAQELYDRADALCTANKPEGRDRSRGLESSENRRVA